MNRDFLREEYAKNGYCFPLKLFSAAEAQEYAERITELAASDIADSLGYRGQINQLHVIYPFVNRMIRNPSLLDAVESILGPNLMVWGVSVFMKPPQSEGFISWHQDLTYWGLNNDQEVAAWIALSPVTRANGCMRFIPESHKLGQIDHRDTVNDSNILTRGQHADIDIDESRAIDVELEPGEASLHHGHLLHCSAANQTDQPRIGMVVNYISTSVRQSVANTDYAMLVRGVDEYNHFEHLPEPQNELDAAGLAWHRKMISAHQEALYDGATNTETAPRLD
jgi:ectoine hydroxylase-related dioxygenase (phytanoyl-CoA dioxygenase family)